jgi:putative transcriptional regulator
MDKLNRSILAAMHETAGDLHDAGLIDKRRMAHYDALCLLPPAPDYGARQVKALRKRLQLSQTVLAGVLGASPSTVRKWEAGDKCPSGPSRRLLDILDRKGLAAVL